MPPNTQKWREEAKRLATTICNRANINSSPLKEEDILPDIESLLTRQLEEVIEIGEKIKKEHCGQEGCGQGQCLNRATRNQAIKSFQSAIKKKKV